MKGVGVLEGWEEDVWYRFLQLDGTCSIWRFVFRSRAFNLGAAWLLILHGRCDRSSIFWLRFGNRGSFLCLWIRFSGGRCRYLGFVIVLQTDRSPLGTSLRRCIGNGNLSNV